MITAYIAVGSNLADPVSQANLAIETLKTYRDQRLLRPHSYIVALQWGHKINQTTSTR